MTNTSEEKVYGKRFNENTTLIILLTWHNIEQWLPHFRKRERVLIATSFLGLATVACQPANAQPNLPALIETSTKILESTLTPTLTQTLTETPTFTKTATQTSTPTLTSTPTITSLPSSTATETATNTTIPSPAPTQTKTETPTKTPTATAKSPTRIPTTPTPKIEIPKKPITAETVDYKYPVVWGNKSRPEIALTFDDGYNPQIVKNTLDVLRKKKIQCTFFIIGNILNSNPDLWKQALADGHQICNHTQNHQFLEKLTNDQIAAEIQNWEKTAEKVLGSDYVKKMKKEFPYLRLPGGSGRTNKNILQIIARTGYIPIGWSDETYSTNIKGHEKDSLNQTSQKIVTHIVAGSKNGSIILFHFNSWDTRGLEQTIDGLAAKGLQLKNVSDVLK